MDPLKEQRDSYLAYALAAADLLVEVDLNFDIVTAVGATRALLGHDVKALQGTSITEAFAPEDQGLVARQLEKAVVRGRIDPVMLHLKQSGKPPLYINLGACRIPSRDGVLHLTMTVLPPMLQGVSHDKDPATGLLQMDDFLGLAADLLRSGSGAAPEMQLVQLGGLRQAVRQLPDDQHGLLFSEIGAALRGQSIGGNAAGRLDDDSFGFLPLDAATSETAIIEDIASVARNLGLAAHILQPKITSINLSVGELDADSITKALGYIAHTFAKGKDIVPQSLESGLNAAMEETVSQYGVMQTMIRTGDFKLHYQPIVSLKDGKTHHYEALLRSNDGRNPFDIVTFSENMGLIADLDLAVARKALEDAAAHPHAEIAINVSGYSAQNEQFCEAFRQVVAPYKSMSNRILFELTETGLVDKIETAAGFFKRLRHMGFKICLDDFGAGSASYHYLRHFEVDYVKIDGDFFNAALTDMRQRALIKSISALCHDLGSEVIAEMIETEASADLARQLDIAYGQGYLYGRPSASLAPPPPPSSPLNARRKGVTESWS